VLRSHERCFARRATPRLPPSASGQRLPGKSWLVEREASSDSTIGLARRARRRGRSRLVRSGTPSEGGEREASASTSAASVHVPDDPDAGADPLQCGSGGCDVRERAGRDFRLRCSARPMTITPAATTTPRSPSESNSRTPSAPPAINPSPPMRSPRKLSSNGRGKKRRLWLALGARCFTFADRTGAASSIATARCAPSRQAASSAISSAHEARKTDGWITRGSTHMRAAGTLEPHHSELPRPGGKPRR
jgi:hypothetical protein